MLRVILTNDDGIQAEGIWQLACELARRCQVTVVAPSTPSSAVSHSITLHKPLRLLPWQHPNFECSPNLQAYSCSGTPSDCVMLGVLELCRDTPPHLVVSGINDGMNVAQDLTYSGTVGGALEGQALGIPSMAVSLEGTDRIDFAQAAKLTGSVLARLLYRKALPGSKLLNPAPGLSANHWVWADPGSLMDAEADWPDPGDWTQVFASPVPCLNVNIPDLPAGEIKGVCWTKAGMREYTDIVSMSKDPRGKPYYWLGGNKVTDKAIPNSDTKALADRFISVTPLQSDITCQQDLDLLTGIS